MARSSASTPEEYHAQLPPERREVVARMREDVIGRVIARTDPDAYIAAVEAARGKA